MNISFEIEEVVEPLLKISILQAIKSYLFEVFWNSFVVVDFWPMIDEEMGNFMNEKSLYFDHFEYPLDIDFPIDSFCKI